MKRDKFESVAARYAATLRACAKLAGTVREIRDWSSGKIRWRLFRFTPPLPSQGWKIHVSAAAVEACELVGRVLPVLFGLAASFKIASRLEDIVYINSGDAGIAQLGKIITVYPRCDAHAREIAQAVHAVWPVSRGPEVRTDLHVSPGSAVSLRFGLFQPGPVVISSTGIYDFALLAGGGELVPDTRSEDGRQPAAAPPPPLACYPPRPGPAKPGEPLAIDHRQYVPLTLLRNTPRAKVFLGFSLDTLHTVVLKAGNPGVAGDHRGIDARARMRKEYAILSALAGQYGLAPRALEWLDGDWPLLVMEDYRGPLLSELPRAQRAEAILALARALARLHAAGFVHGDLKLENAVWRPPHAGLIDFELAEREGDAIGTGGTPGYLAPEVKRDARAAFSRDIFALGGCVVQSVLDVPPGLFPDGGGRLRGLLALEGAGFAGRLHSRLSATNPAARPTAQAAAALIAGQAENFRHLRPSFGSPITEEERGWCRRAGVEAAWLVSDYSHDESGARCWRNEHFMRLFQCEALNLGAAGIIIGLASIDRAVGRNDFSADLDRGASWLASRPAASGAAGLFTGDAAVSVALAVAGRRLGRKSYINASRRRLQSAAADGREIDLFSGAAGVLFASCLIHGILDEDWPLEIGNAVAGDLQRHFNDNGPIPLWTAADDSDPYLGCAHGCAGIAMALACWGNRSGDRSRVEIALRTFRQLFTAGRTSTGSAIRITLKTDRAHATGTWCHGLAGYLWCILQGVGDHPELRQIIDWAVQALRESMTAGTPTYCHGLAGRLELWRMIAGISRHRELALSQAGKTVRALRLLHHKRKGKITWCSDDPAVTTPDLWIGFLGPATALALHAGGFAAPLLSPQWLAACAHAAATRDLTPL